MKPQTQPLSATQSTRTLMTALVILAIPMTLLGLVFLGIGISGGALLGTELERFEILQNIGKGGFMFCMGLVGGMAAYRQLKKAKLKRKEPTH